MGQTPVQNDAGVRWALVASGVALVATCYGLARFAYGLFASQFQAAFALSQTLSGVIGAGSYVGYCVAIVASLVLTERLGARRVAVSAGLVATLGTATVAVAPTALVLAVGVLIAGSSTGLASPPMAAAVNRWIRTDIRDRSQSVVNAGTGLGVLVSGPVALALSDHWRLAWGLFAGIAAAVTVWVYLSVPDPDPSTDLVSEPAAGADANPDRPVESGGSADPHQARFLPGTGRLVLAAMLMGLSSAAVWTFGRNLITTIGSASGLVSTTMWTVLGAAGILGALGGDLVARVGVARSWSVAMVVMAAATSLLALAPGSALAIYTAAAVFGAAYIILTALVLIWATRIYPRRASYGVGLGFLMIAIGQAIGAPLAGVLTDQSSPTTAFYTCAALGLLGALIRPTRTTSAANTEPTEPAGA